MSSPLVHVKLWGRHVGDLAYVGNQTEIATFQYTDTLFQSPFSLSPVHMPTKARQHTFDDISFRTFKGLPGVIADSLPDAFGNQLIDTHMAKKNIPQNEITALDRLLYLGNRAMGALEFEPAEHALHNRVSPLTLDIHQLAELSNIVAKRDLSLNTKLKKMTSYHDSLSLVRVSASAGGARAKALIARDESGQIFDGTPLYTTPHRYYLIKFDSDENQDRDKRDPKGMTRVEYVYCTLAKELGLDVPDTDVILDKDDCHFLIERFDRHFNTEKNITQKLAFFSWAGLAHAHRDATGVYSYEQLAMLARELSVSQRDVTEIFKRAAFNIVGRNQDDHTKNFAFMVDKLGQWSLSQAYDLTYSFDPTGRWTKTHQISLNGKVDDFSRDDLMAFASHCNVTKRKANQIIDNTLDGFSQIEGRLQKMDVEDELVGTIVSNLRIDTLSLTSTQASKQESAPPQSPAP